MHHHQRDTKSRSSCFPKSKIRISSRFVPRLALAFPLRAFFGLYSSCSFLFISIYYLLSSSSCRIFIYFDSSFLFSFFFSSLLGSRSARLCALFCVRRPFGLLFLLDSSRIPPNFCCGACETYPALRKPRNTNTVQIPQQTVDNVSEKS